MSVTITSVVPGNNQLTVNWTSGGLYGFNVYYGTSNPSTFFGWTSAKTSTITGLTNNVLYNIAVIQLDDYGEETVYHDEASGTPGVATALPGAAVLTVTPGVYKNVLTWTLPTGGGIDYYRVYTFNHFDNPVLLTDTIPGSTRTYTASGLEDGLEHAYLVNAHNSFGWGADSNVDSATPLAPGDGGSVFGTATELIYDNLISNGSFESGTTVYPTQETIPGWTKNGSATFYGRSNLFVQNGTRSLRIDVAIGALCSATQSFSSTVGNIYYLRAIGNWDGDTPQTTDRSGSIGFVNDASGPKFGGSTTIVSTTFSAVSTTTTIFITNRNIGGSKEATLHVDNVMLLNLTEIFGAGNEPSAADIDSYIKFFNSGGWWDSDNPKTLRRDDIRNRCVNSSFETALGDEWDTTGEGGEFHYTRRIALPATIGGVYVPKIHGDYCLSQMTINNTVPYAISAWIKSYPDIDLNHYAYVSAVGMTIEYPSVATENNRAVVEVVTSSGTYNPGGFANYLPYNSWSRKSYKHKVVSEIPNAPNASVALRLACNGNTAYSVFDAVTVLDLNETFNASIAETITNGAVDSILNAMGGSWESVPVAPTDVVVTATRAADTCKFKVEVKVRGLLVSQYKIYRSTNGTDYTYVQTINADADPDVYSTWKYDTNNNSYFGGNTQLWYKVSGVNSIGEGDLSSAVSDTTERNQPSTPSFISGNCVPGVTSEGVLKVSLKWDVSTFPAGSISKYELQRKKTSEGSGSWIVLGSTALDNYTDYNGLVKNTSYDYRVKSYSTCTVDNISEYSTTISRTTLNTPSAPTNGSVVYSTTAKIASISWSVPTDDGGNTIKYYKISSTIPGFVTGTQAGLTYTYDGSANSSFVANTSYSFYITAFNSVGEGVILTITGSTPKLQTPPGATSFDQIFFDKVVGGVTYKGIKIKGYCEDYRTWLNSGSATVTGLQMYRSSSSVSTQGLNILYGLDETVIEPGTTYTYSFRLDSAWGQTSSGASRNFTTESKPAAPTDLTAVWDSSDTGFFIDLNWTTPEAKTYVTGYRIQRSPFFTGTEFKTVDGSSTAGYDDHDLATGTYTFHVRTQTNLWSSTDLGLAGDSDPVVLASPAAPSTLYVKKLGGRSGSYSNIFFNKLVWQIPQFSDEIAIYNALGIPCPYTENTIKYEIYRNTINDFGPSSSKIKLGETIGRDTSFYDAATAKENPTSYPRFIQPNTTYYYKVLVTSDFGDSTYSGPDPIPTIDLTSPNFSLYASNDKGTNNWKCRAGLKVDSDGYPTITIRTDEHPPVIGTGTIVIYGEISPDGKTWIKFGEHAATNAANPLEANKEKVLLEHGRSYSVRKRAVVVETGETSSTYGVSNVITLTTFTLNGNSFPNMMPNSGLQFGRVSSSAITSDVELYNINSGGTWQAYNNIGLSIFSGKKKIRIDTLLSTRTIEYNSGRGVLFAPTSDTETNNFIKNISSYKFPTPQDTEYVGETRYYALCGRYAKEYNYTLKSINPELEIVEKNTAVSTGSAMRLYVNTGREFIYDWKIDTGSTSYIANNSVPDLFIGTFSDSSYTQQKFFNFKFSEAYYEDPIFGYPLAILRGSIGDLMIFDLSSIFGGNGGDIYNTASEITGEDVYNIVNSSIEQWWDFDYESNMEIPPSQYLSAEVISATETNTVHIELQSVDDVTGGLDTCGYLPALSYSIQYRRVGNEFYEDKSPLYVTRVDPRAAEFYLTPTDDNILNGRTYQIRYAYSNSNKISIASDSVPVTTLPVPDEIDEATLKRYTAITVTADSGSPQQYYLQGSYIDGGVHWFATFNNLAPYEKFYEYTFTEAVKGMIRVRFNTYSQGMYRYIKIILNGTPLHITHTSADPASADPAAYDGYFSIDVSVGDKLEFWGYTTHGYPQRFGEFYINYTKTSTINNKIKIGWISPDDNDYDIDSYTIHYGNTKDSGSWTEIVVPYDEDSEEGSYNINTVPNEIYYCTIKAHNAYGYADESDVFAGPSSTFPSAPTNIRFTFEENAGIDEGTANVVAYWDAPEDDGCSLTGTTGIIGYNILFGTDVNNLTSRNLGPTEYLFELDTGVGTNTYKLSVGSICYFKIAAITSYTNSIATNLPGIYTDLKTVKYMSLVETIKIRGTAYNEGYLDFYFTARTEDGTYIQYNNSFYRLLAGGAEISENANIYNIKELIDEISTKNNLYLNGTTRVASWPSGIVTSVETQKTTDMFGEALLINFTMGINNPDGYLYDVHVQQEGLDGIGSFLIITDYTTDVSFYTKGQQIVDPFEIVDTTTTGSLIWTVNAAFVFEPYKSKNENVPQVKKEFWIPVLSGDKLFDVASPSGTIKDKIENGVSGVCDSLQDQMRDYFTGPTSTLPEEIKSMYQDASYSGGYPFVVECTILNSDDASDRKDHLKVNIRTMMERVQNQISCKTTNLRSFYLKTKPNTYYVANQMMELRSFEDMYGRNKPGSSSFSGNYQKRSYGFRFNLDYITEYDEEEAATIDLTPIPGTSSGNAIGLDMVGTTRTINIAGVRVDNSNDWMFHAPFEYVDDSVTNGSQIMQGGVIYVGTSNWGWSKFMKATMGTFQFIDGPYRLIMMTLPSSLMQQYVPDRYCKYQYPDGTYIVQAGTEDMCYVMIESFQTAKSEDMFNAISYRLRLRRAIPLGSTI